MGLESASCPPFRALGSTPRNAGALRQADGRVGIHRRPLCRRRAGIRDSGRPRITGDCKAKETTDESAAKLCHDIVTAFEQQLTYPGEIKGICRRCIALVGDAFVGVGSSMPSSMSCGRDVNGRCCQQAVKCRIGVRTTVRESPLSVIKGYKPSGFKAGSPSLSFFHQGSLGGLYGVLRGRPFAFRQGFAIWPSTFFLFILSAIAVGPSS